MSQHKGFMVAAQYAQSTAGTQPLQYFLDSWRRVTLYSTKQPDAHDKSKRQETLMVPTRNYYAWLVISEEYW